MNENRSEKTKENKFAKKREEGSKKKVFLIITMVAVLIIIMGCIISNKVSINSPIYYRYLVQRYLPSVADSLKETSTIELNYITNVNDSKEVSKITFVNAPELQVVVDGQSEERYGIYKRCTVGLYMEWNQEKLNQLPQVVQVEKIHVEYSDHSMQTVNIGKIDLYSGKESELLEATSAIPLWESERVQEYVARQSLIMEGLSEQSKELLGEEDILDTVSLKSGEEDLFNLKEPVRLEKGDPVICKMTYKAVEKGRLLDESSQYDAYEIEPKIQFRDMSGKEKFVVIYNANVIRQFKDYWGVRRYIKKRQS